MAGLPKAYFKRFPGNLKKAWAAYRAEKGGKKKAAPAKKHHAKKASGKPARKQGGHKMAKAKKAAKRAGHALRAGMETRPGKVLMAAGTAAAGGVATSFVINKTPKIKDLSQGMKSALQGGAGLAAIVLGRKKWIKGMGAGAVIAAVFGLTKAVLKIDPLAGPSAGTPTLSPSQMRQLTGGQMNVPASVRMNVPARVSMGGRAPIGGWSSGGWGNAW